MWRCIPAPPLCILVQMCCSMRPVPEAAFHVAPHVHLFCAQRVVTTFPGNAELPRSRPICTMQLSQGTGTPKSLLWPSTIHILITVLRAVDRVGRAWSLAIFLWRDGEHMQPVDVAVEHTGDRVQMVVVVPEHFADGVGGQQPVYCVIGSAPLKWKTCSPCCPATANNLPEGAIFRS
jgi:hypothetical protein